MIDETEGDLEKAALRKLSVHDIDAGSAERIRGLAHAILADQREQEARRSGRGRLYSRFLEPALVSSVVVIYLIWAVNRVLFFFQISMLK